MLNGRRYRVAAGVSLVEAMVVLTVSAVVLGYGVPSMGRWMHELEVRNSASALVAALQAARAEAIVRNAVVRLSLGDAQGRAAWRLSCVRVSAQCPATIRQQPVRAADGARWGASTLAAMPAFDAALAAGASLPASIDVDALGAVPAVAAGTGVARIDITHAADARARRLVVLVAAQGLVRVCDPLAAAGRPEHCH